jgi:DNA primase
MFLCFSCGESGNVIDMVMRTTNRTYFEAARLINSRQNTVDIERQVDDAIENSQEYPQFDMKLINELHNNLLSSNRAREYFYRRNIEDDSFSEFLLGFSEKQDMVIVPVFDEHGKCLGFVARSVEGKSFKNSVGLPKSKILFNLNKVKRHSIVVVESSFDVIRLHQQGFSAVATLGATVSRKQLSLLQQYANKIIICPDSDDAGHKMTDKIVKGITNKSIDVVSLSNAKDVGDLSNEELVEVFNKYSGNHLTLTV